MMPIQGIKMWITTTATIWSLYWTNRFGKGFYKQHCPTFGNIPNWILILIHLNITHYELLSRRTIRVFMLAVLLRNISTILSDTPLVSLIWLSLEIQWHGPKHLCIHPNMWTLTYYDRTLSSFDIVFVCGNWFLPGGAQKNRSSERSSGAWWQFCVRRKTDSTQTPMSVWREGRRWPHFIYSKSLIYILAATAQFMYQSHLRTAYNNPASS